MTTSTRACGACRQILREGGYTVTEKDYELLDDCLFCGRHTAVKRCTIEKGERKR